MQTIVRKTEKLRVKKVRELMQRAGNTIGSVHFKKRSDGVVRKMCYRLHTYNPTYASKPNGKGARKSRNTDNNLMTVFDVNKVLRAKSGRRKGKISGRGDYRSIPLENVTRIKVKGKLYRIKSS